ncbi:AraC family transcriptional regulator [Pseudoxanthomonas sp. PXM01]|uniref:helix-turn-helix domain-containing protein n=1 Tax=Pseudoxanthomonas sp. PXM01 TaxID=2769295 RepID=UPI00177EF571|nr:AraC family transcriptional regulator [Pseudoxanthomonas sp. PXM01]MBD9471121.1 helix-turn-helix transcriptional regulator [Pseudoxanthomonas sp. PXM01]
MSGRYRQHDFASGQSLLCHWEYVQGSQATPALVLPDACVDLLWDGDRLSVAGPDTQAQYARLAPDSRLQGLRFAPTVAARWLGTPLHVLANHRIELRDLGIPRLTALADRMDEHGPQAMAWLAGRIFAEAPTHDDAMRAVHAHLSDARPLSIAQLAGELGLTERTLLRRCDDAFGYGPKTLARILRLQRFLHAQRSTPTLLEAALDAGYYDAAQLAGEARRLTGLTPTQLVLQVAG